MNKNAMRSKERVLATIKRQPVDHVPLCVEGLCHGHARHVSEKMPHPVERSKYYLGLGLDTAIQFCCPSFATDGIRIREWRDEPSAGEPFPILHKEYTTPGGRMRQVVRKTEDYADDSIQLICDHNVPPTRSIEYLVSSEEHLDALACLLRPPAGREMDEFVAEVKRHRRFCDEAGILMSVYAWGVGDPMVWFSGVEPLLFLAMEQPAMFQRYVDIVAAWNRTLIELALDCKVDLVVRRGWYESTDFWSPSLYEQFFLEPLKRDVALCHQAGVLFDYVMASGSTPLLSFFREAGVDIYSNIDPHAPHTDMRAIKAAIGDSITLCGGINNYHVLEIGAEADVDRAVAEALESLGPDGCILAPSDALNTTADSCVPNFHRMIETWKKLTW